MASLALNRLTVPRGAILSAILALAMLSSSVVFSEPAPVDVLLLGFIVALCILGGGRLGAVTPANLVLWLPLIALAFVAVLAGSFFAGVPSASSPHIVASISVISRTRIGLERYSSIPDSMQRSRSPGIASAVNAIIGTLWTSELLRIC